MGVRVLPGLPETALQDQGLGDKSQEVGGMIERIRRYLASVRAEVQRVSWPSRREVITFTVLIVLMVVVLGLYLGLVDAVLQQILRLLIG